MFGVAATGRTGDGRDEGGRYQTAVTRFLHGRVRVALKKNTHKFHLPYCYVFGSVSLNINYLFFNTV